MALQRALLYCLPVALFLWILRVPSHPKTRKLKAKISFYFRLVNEKNDIVIIYVILGIYYLYIVILSHTIHFDVQNFQIQIFAF